MQENLKNLVQAALVAALVAVSVAGLWYVQAFALDKGVMRTFSVTGEAKRVAIPDVARFTVGVTAKGKSDLGSIQKGVNKTMDTVVQYLKEQGVEEKDIKTIQYDVSPQYSYPPCKYDYSLSPAEFICPPVDIIGYSVAQRAEVTIRNFEKIAEILGGVVEQGANDVSSLTFELEHPEELQNEARTEAIEKARRQAQSIAKAGKFRIGTLESVMDNKAPYDSYGYERMSYSPTVSSVQPGTQEISSSVTLRYRIR